MQLYRHLLYILFRKVADFVERNCCVNHAAEIFGLFFFLNNLQSKDLVSNINGQLQPVFARPKIGEVFIKCSETKLFVEV